MSDPLIDYYNASFATEHPSRKLFKTHFRLTESDLKRMSDAIQRYGTPAKATTPPSEVVRADPIKPPAEWLNPPQLLTLVTRAPTWQEQLAAEKAKFAAQMKAIPSVWEPVHVEEDILFELYEKMVADEYAALGSSDHKAPFAEFEQRKGTHGLPLYRDLRPVYYREGIRQPHKFIMDKMIEPTSAVKIGGKTVGQGIHKEFARMLQEVEKGIDKIKAMRSVMGQPDARPVGYAGSFRPSPIGSRASNHMLGAAIDIDSGANPHLKGAEITALDEMLKFWAEYQNDKHKNDLNPPPQMDELKVRGSWLAELPKLDAENAVERASAYYEKAVEVSKRTKDFLNEFLAEALKRTSTPQDQWKQRAFAIVDDMVKKFKGGAATLQLIKTEGFISVPAELFKALVSHPELQWGLYTNVDVDSPQREAGLDIMHFEVKPSVRRDLIIGKNGYP